MRRVPLFLHELFDAEFGINGDGPYLRTSKHCITHREASAVVRCISEELLGSIPLNSKSIAVLADRGPLCPLLCAAASRMGIPAAVITREVLAVWDGAGAYPQGTVVIEARGSTYKTSIGPEWREALTRRGAPGASACGDRQSKQIDLDPALVFFSSGSTGAPKGIVMSHLAILGACESISRYLPIGPEDRVLLLSPWSFDYGFYQALLAAYNGAELVLPSLIEISSAEGIGALIIERGITILPLMPSLFRTWGMKWRKAGLKFPSVRLVTFTGGQFPSEVMHIIDELFGDATVYSMYGATECKRVSYLPPTRLRVKPNSVGVAIPNVRILLDGPSAFDALSEGSRPEEIAVQTRNSMTGYLDPMTMEFPRISSRLRLGDIGFMDGDGDLTLIGRRDDVVKIRDIRICLSDLEGRLRSIVGVTEAAALASAELLQVYLEVTETTDHSILLRDAKGMLIADYRLGAIAAIAIVERLPRNANGKVDKKALKR